MTTSSIPPDPLWFSTSTTSTAPSDPGIYAWYAVPEAGPADWQVTPGPGGVDTGPELLAQFLGAHTKRLNSPPLRMKVSWHLWAAWTGEVGDVGTARLVESLEKMGSVHAKGVGSTSLHWALHNVSAREALANILLASSPRLVAPIYIGVSRNLAQRLPQHVKAFDDALVHLRAHGALTSDHLKGFGGRAAAAGLRHADLRVGVLPVTSIATGLTAGEQRTVVEAAEFVLNRWHRPILGRR